MNLPKRKQNRLKNFDYGQNGAYFITICVKDRKPILSDIVGDDAHIVPKKCGIIVEKYIKNVPEIKKCDNARSHSYDNTNQQRDDVGIVPYKKGRKYHSLNENINNKGIG